MSVSTLIPAAFPALALAHFLALLSPGPDFFLIIGHAVRHRLRGSLFICLGIALGNALYTFAARAGRIDVAAVLSSLYPVSTIALALTILRERLRRPQAVGIVIAVIAIVLVAL